MYFVFIKFGWLHRYKKCNDTRPVRVYQNFEISLQPGINDILPFPSFEQSLNDDP